MSGSMRSLLPGGEEGITVVTPLYSFPDDRFGCSKERFIRDNVLQLSNNFEEVLVLADNTETCENMTMLGISNIKCEVHSCMDTNFDRPMVPCLFRAAERKSAYNVIMFTNSDIYPRGVKAAVDVVAGAIKTSFLIVGQRIDISDMNSLCEKKVPLSGINTTLGMEHGPYGIDYYIFRKGSLPINEMPPFLLGCWKWDNWLLDQAISKDNTAVVDASLAIDAFHLGTNEITDHTLRKGGPYNLELYTYFYDYPYFSQMHPVGHGEIRCATRYIKDGALLKREKCF